MDEGLALLFKAEVFELALESAEVVDVQVMVPNLGKIFFCHQGLSVEKVLLNALAVNHPSEGEVGLSVLEVQLHVHLSVVVSEVLMFLAVDQLAEVLMLLRDVLQEQCEGDRIKNVRLAFNYKGGTAYLHRWGQ